MSFHFDVVFVLIFDLFLIFDVASVYVPQIKEVERLRASSKHLDIYIFFSRCQIRFSWY